MASVRRLCVLASSLVATALTVGSVRAEPLITSLTEMLAQTEAVVVATYQGPADLGATLGGYQVDIERVAWRAKGSTVTTGSTVLAVGSGQASGEVGSRMVIVVTRGRALGFAASPVAGGSIDGLLQLRGFYDYNAHLITPTSLLTLEQLVGLARGGKTLDYRVRGRVHVLSDDGQSVVPVGRELTVTHRRALAGKSTTTVAGFAPKGLPEPSLTLGVGMDDDPTVGLAYRNSWPRPLMLRGRVRAVDPDGTLQVDFVVSMPDLITADQLTTYAADPSLSHPRWRAEVRLQSGPRWLLEDGAGYTGSPKLTLAPDTAPIGISSMDVRGAKRLIRYGYPRPLFELELGKAPSGASLDTYGTLRTFRQELHRGPVSCRVRGGEHDGVGCTIVLESVRFEGPVRAN